MILSLGSAILSGNVSCSKADASVGNYSTSASTYYSGITAISRATLLGQLHDLLATTHKTYTTYDDCKNLTYVYATDAGTSSSYVRDFYTQKNIASSWGSGATGTWNREHVWCQSLYNSLCGVANSGSSGSSDDSGGSTDTNSATITMKYSDTFSPALPTSSTAVNTSATSHTDSTAGYIYNTSSLGTISSIAFAYSSGTSTSGKIGVYFASSAKRTYTTSSNVTIGGKSATDTFINSTSGYGYFQISTSTANVQIVSIVINCAS